MKKLIVQLDSGPVSIDPTIWRGGLAAKTWDNQYECQWKTYVRTHRNGRVMVYGVRDAYDGDYRGGHVFPNVAEAARYIPILVEEMGAPDCDAMISQTRASLPAVDLD